MKKSVRPLISRLSLAVGASLVLASPSAFAIGDAERLIVWMSGVQPYINKAIAAAETAKQILAMNKGANQVSDTIEKNAQSTKSVIEGVSAWEAQNQLKRDISEMNARLEQPKDTCADMAARTAIGNADGRARSSVAPAQAKVMKSINTSTSPQVNMEIQQRETNAKFCSPEDKSRGLCSGAAPAGYEKLAGADQDAMYLFQGTDGSDSYDGDAQTDAVDSYIRRVVAQMPPELLADKNWDNTKKGRAYIEMVRRYRSFISMPLYSLNMIRAARSPQVGLGTATAMADMSQYGLSGYTVRPDMSMSEAVRRFIALKFSPQQVQDMSTATSPEKLLREQLKVSSYQLWLDYQTLLHTSRMEGLTALQLTLMTDQALRPAIEAQRRRASGVN